MFRVKKAGKGLDVILSESEVKLVRDSIPQSVEPAQTGGELLVDRTDRLTQRQLVIKVSARPVNRFRPLELLPCCVLDQRFEPKMTAKKNGTAEGLGDS